MNRLKQTFEQTAKDLEPLQTSNLPALWRNMSNGPKQNKKKPARKASWMQKTLSYRCQVLLNLRIQELYLKKPGFLY